MDAASIQKSTWQSNHSSCKHQQTPFVERVVRTNLAATYQILALQGLDDLTYTHVSSRVPGTDYFFIYPFGLMFEEVTATKLMKVSLGGEILEGTEHQYNRTGYIIHGNIYRARPEINTIIHLHTPASVAVAATKDGLLPLSQWALHFYESLAYHKYNSLALDNSVHGDPLVRDLGEMRAMLMQNHGLLTCGVTAHEALFYVHHLELACQTQCHANHLQQNLIMPSDEVCQQAKRDLLSFERDLGYRDWLAWMRKLDREGIIYDDWETKSHES